MEDQALYQLALSRIKGIGPVHTKDLIKHFGNASSIFHAGRNALRSAGLHPHLAEAILNFSDYPRLRKELQHLHAIGARTIFYTDPDYPYRLLPISNAPPLLFFQGNADLNAAKIIAIAGTRKPTAYGIQITAQLIRELARPDLLILSGLAYGIDAIAHQTALKYNIPTVGVIGHGLDHVYPAVHRGLFQTMRRRGGILTSFLHEVGPESYTFPLRNKLVAGCCDALIVIESSNTGGSLSAAAAALQFNKKVFALPGRITDEKSRGCLQLIHAGRALPLVSADQLKAAIGWDWASGHLSHQPPLPFTGPSTSQLNQPTAEPSDPTPPSNSATLPPDPMPPSNPATLPPDPITPSDQDNSRQPVEDQLISLLTHHQPRTFEDLLTLTREPIPSISVALFRLETRGIIRPLPGRRYQLVTQATTHFRHTDNQAG